MKPFRWLFNKLVNPRLNLLLSALFILAFEVFAISMTGYTGWWFWLSLAAVASSIFFYRLEDVGGQPKVWLACGWYASIALLTIIDPMGFMIYGLPWTLAFIVGTHVSAIYSVVVSLVFSVISYRN